MRRTPYLRLDSDSLTLRDELALDRTLLANERTLMAYLRSGVALMIAGGTIMHFASRGWFWAIGLACLPIGVLAALIGARRYRAMNRKIERVRRQPEPDKGTVR